MALFDGLPFWIERLVLAGISPDDPDDARVAKALLNTSALGVATLAPGWWIVLLLLDRPWSAAIPLVYQILTYVGLAIVAATGRHDWFRVSELFTITVLPALLMWTLGGFASSGAIILWSLGAVVMTQIFSARRWPWTIGFAGLVVVSAALDPWLVENVEPLPTLATRAFFLMNLVGLAITTSIVIRYFVRQRDEARSALEAEQHRSETLLLNVLPPSIADRLKSGESPIADAAPTVTVLFADIVGFTPMASGLAPDAVVRMLNEIFTELDQLAARHGLEKIKTIGDEYMVVAGLPDSRSDHADAVARFALDAIAALEGRETPVSLRIGMDTGPVVAGVIGETRFAYDLWGDTVNVASRMESHGVPGRIQVTGRVLAELGDRCRSEARGTIDVKGKGPMETYFLLTIDTSDGSMAV